MKTIKYNGNEYRIRYVRRGADATAAAINACRKCAFAEDGPSCGCTEDCTVFNKHNRHSRVTHYAYFRKVNPDSPWPDIAIGLVALAVAAVLGLLCSSCSGPEVREAPEAVKEMKSGVTVTKKTVEGHEYLIFRGGLNTWYNRSVAAVHSESCPCKAKEGGR